MSERAPSIPRRPEAVWPVVVVGAGFAGLATALRLAELGKRVLLLEALNYPGGCASTFERGGYRFESGATLFAGLAPEQLFGRWIRQHSLDVHVDWLDPVLELRTPDLELPVGARRAQLIERFCELPDAPAAGIREFFAYQESLAAPLWSALESRRLLSSFGPAALFELAGRAPGLLPVLPLMGKPLGAVLERFGLARFEPLRHYLDALCQITVQCSSAEAEAPFALSAIDYPWRGTGHVRGGIGRLAEGLLDALRRAGGEVRLAHRVRGLERVGRRWRLTTARAAFEAERVVANLLPQNLRELLGDEVRRPDALAKAADDVAGGWGACMLYRAATPPSGAPPRPKHLELVDDPTQPFVEGNHVFVSISGPHDGPRAPEGQRTLTVSTHIDLAALLALPEAERGPKVAEVQERMRRTIARRAPEWDAGTTHELTASPRTFERFTGRREGWVGGIPRRAGLHHYTSFFPPRWAPRLHAIGDSAFPGQSILATATGGVKLAERLA